MKNLYFHIVYLFLLAIATFSCVEDDLDIPEESITISESQSLITLLNSVGTGELDFNDVDLQFTYPINLALTNGVVVTIQNNEGLLETVLGQSTDLYINGLEYPLAGEFASQDLSIDNEQDFIAFLNTIDVPTLKNVFQEAYLQCFEVTFPVGARDNNGVNVVLQNMTGLMSFLELLTGQLQLQYPVELVVYDRDDIVLVNSDFDLHQLLNTCDGCPQLFFEVQQEGANQFSFIQTGDSVGSYDWVINDIFIESDGPANGGDNQLMRTFEPGTYEVCMESTTPDCALGIAYCEIITAEDPCPTLSFVTEQTDSFLYEFTADFPLRDSIFYEWQILINDDLIASEVEQPGGDNTFLFQFSPGIYDICLVTETPQCPQGISYCEELEVR